MPADINQLMQREDVREVVDGGHLMAMSVADDALATIRDYCEGDLPAALDKLNLTDDERQLITAGVMTTHYGGSPRRSPISP